MLGSKYFCQEKREYIFVGVTPYHSGTELIKTMEGRNWMLKLTMKRHDLPINTIKKVFDKSTQ